jgi:hypothetical protein
VVVDGVLLDVTVSEPEGVAVGVALAVPEGVSLLDAESLAGVELGEAPVESEPEGVIEGDSLTLALPVELQDGVGVGVDVDEPVGVAVGSADPVPDGLSPRLREDVLEADLVVEGVDVGEVVALPVAVGVGDIDGAAGCVWEALSEPEAVGDTLGLAPRERVAVGEPVGLALAVGVRVLDGVSEGILLVDVGETDGVGASEPEVEAVAPVLSVVVGDPVGDAVSVDDVVEVPDGVLDEEPVPDRVPD